MSTAVLACPYCNAEVNVGPGLAAGHKVVCPRCGEAFPLRQPTTAVQAPSGVTNAPAPTFTPPPAPTIPALAGSSKQSANRLVAGIVVSVMVLMAGLGLTYALMTQDYRRSNDKGLVKQRLFRPARPALGEGPGEEGPPPANPLAGLGYLPADTNIIVHALVPELKDSEAGQQLLHERLAPGGQPITLSRVEEVTGLKLDEIETLTVGTRADDKFIPPITLVVRTREPHEQKMIAALHAKLDSAAGHGRNDVYKFTAKDMPVLLRRGYLWCADDRTVVVRLLALEKMDNVPTQEAKNLSQFSEAIRNLIQKRTDTKAPLWAVAEVLDWSQGAPVLVPNNLKPPDAALLKQVQSATFWVRPSRPAKLGLVVGCVSDTAASGLEKRYLIPNKPRKGLTWSRDKEWLTVGWTGDLAELRKALSK